jgi:glycosyltransferase involved in cell wall biosynthesis
MRLGVLIPAYDAGATLAGVIARLSQGQPLELERIAIVDDASRDYTAKLASDLAVVDPRVTVLTHRTNRGYGAAVKTGLAHLREAGMDAAACVHADGQYAPEELPRLVEAASSRGLDLVQGSRIASGSALSGGMPLYKYLANRALTALENRVLGLGFTDYHSGYLLYGRRALHEIPLSGLSDSFDFDLEVIASARALGLRLGEVPVATHYGDEVSHLRSIPYGLRCLRVMFNHLRGAYPRT